MMRCLELGGLPAFYDTETSRPSESNKYGNYEASREQLRAMRLGEDDGILNRPGEVVKVMVEDMFHTLKDRFYRVVLMLRNPASIYASYKKHFGEPTFVLDSRMLSVKDYRAYHELIGNVTCFLSELPSVDLQTLNYDCVVEQPETEFKKLQDAGWPIDAAKAANGVDEQERHF